MYKTILFDLDGTILNTAEGITEGVRIALEGKGLPPLPYEIRELFIGPPLRNSFQKYCGVDADTAEALLADYRVFYGNEGLHLARPYEGIENLLKSLCASGKELFIATSKPTSYSKIMLDEWGLSGYFKEIVGAGMGKNMDAKDKIIAYCLSKAESKNAIMVGDTMYDVIGAHQNNIPAVGVLYGFGDHDELRASKPLYLAETVEELGGIL
ncbi:MAG: HAD hydrolase-like protein [Clostridia bacterium]|nr:HAD hydrolase-like protein [Clostridia bacterium]